MRTLHRYTLPALSKATGISTGILRRWYRAGWLAPVAFNGKSALFSQESFEVAEQRSLTVGVVPMSQLPVSQLHDAQPRRIDYAAIF
jgi:hypothetical protein